MGRRWTFQVLPCCRCLAVWSWLTAPLPQSEPSFLILADVLNRFSSSSPLCPRSQCFLSCWLLQSDNCHYDDLVRYSQRTGAACFKSANCSDVLLPVPESVFTARSNASDNYRDYNGLSRRSQQDPIVSV